MHVVNVMNLMNVTNARLLSESLFLSLIDIRLIVCFAIKVSDTLRHFAQGVSQGVSQGAGPRRLLRRFGSSSRSKDFSVLQLRKL